MDQQKIVYCIALTIISNLPLCKWFFQEDYSPYYYWITLPLSIALTLNLFFDHPQPAQLENTGMEELPLPVFSFAIAWETDHTTAEENEPIVVEASNQVHARRAFRKLKPGAYIVHVDKIEEHADSHIG